MWSGQLIEYYMGRKIEQQDGSSERLTRPLAAALGWVTVGRLIIDLK